MPHSPAVLLLDDGELDDVQMILEGLGVEFGRVKGGAIVADMPPPETLLVSTPRRIHAISCEADDGADPPTRIVVVNEDSNSLRARLREIGFDYLVRRPVHPEALRLLVMHCVYRGEERRSEPRVAVGYEVSFRTGAIGSRATLVDLSSRGCRLMSARALDDGSQVQIVIPEELGASEPLTLKGRVLRTIFDEDAGRSGMHSVAVVFEQLSNGARNELEWIIAERTEGPVTWPGEAAAGGGEAPGLPPRRLRTPKTRRSLTETVSPNYKPDPRSEGSEAADALAPVTSTPFGIPVDVKLVRDPEPTLTDEPAPGAGPDRREHDRRVFEGKIPAFGGRALRVLVGRDLSARGMRIHRSEELELGDRLHLAIYAEADEEPFLVWGTVARDDGDDGMAVQFDEVHEIVAEKLERLIASLPAVESLHDDEASAMGTVLTEILED